MNRTTWCWQSSQHFRERERESQASHAKRTWHRHPCAFGPRTRKSPSVPQASHLLQKLQFEAHQPGKEEMKRLACKCLFLPATASASPGPSSDGARWANVQARSISIDEISLWNPCSQGQGKLEGEQLEAGVARAAVCWAPPRAVRACRGSEPGPRPARRAAGLSPKSPNRAEAGRGSRGGAPGSNEVRGTAATAAESIWR